MKPKDSCHQDSWWKHLNTEIENIMLNAKYSGLRGLWQYILFNYNIHNVEEAKKLANFHKLEIMFVESYRPYIDPEIKNVKLNDEYKKMEEHMGWNNIKPTSTDSINNIVIRRSALIVSSYGL